MRKSITLFFIFCSFVSFGQSFNAFNNKLKVDATGVYYNGSQVAATTENYQKIYATRPNGKDTAFTVIDSINNSTLYPRGTYFYIYPGNYTLTKTLTRSDCKIETASGAIITKATVGNMFNATTATDTICIIGKGVWNKTTNTGKCINLVNISPRYCFLEGNFLSKDDNALYISVSSSQTYHMIYNIKGIYKNSGTAAAIYILGNSNAGDYRDEYNIDATITSSNSASSLANDAFYYKFVGDNHASLIINGFINGNITITNSQAKYFKCNTAINSNIMNSVITLDWVATDDRTLNYPIVFNGELHEVYFVVGNYVNCIVNGSVMGGFRTNSIVSITGVSKVVFNGIVENKYATNGSLCNLADGECIFNAPVILDSEDGTHNKTVTVNGGKLVINSRMVQQNGVDEAIITLTCGAVELNDGGIIENQFDGTNSNGINAAVGTFLHNGGRFKIKSSSANSIVVADSIDVVNYNDYYTTYARTGACNELITGGGTEIADPQVEYIYEDEWVTTENLVVSYDADHVLSAGGYISQLTDQSTNLNNATQGTGASQPALIATQLNGHPVARFDGSNDYFTTASDLTLTKLTMVAVVKRTSSVNSMFLGSKNANYSGVQYNGDGHLYVMDASSYGDVDITNTTDYQIVAIEYTGTQVKVWKNSSYVGADTYTYADASLLLNKVGTRNYIADPAYWVGDIAAIKVYNIALQNSQVLKVIDELNDYYDIY